MHMKISKRLLVPVIILFACSPPQQKVEFISKGKIDYPVTADDENMLDSIQHKTFLFFLNEHHPEWGIVKDRAADWAPCSIAATGFGIPVLCDRCRTELDNPRTSRTK